MAYGKQHGTPLRAGEFSGGLATVIPTLTRLGFEADAAPHPLSRLEVGTTYKRKHLLEMFGGQLQSGIWTPREFPIVLLFSGESGEQYGYQDKWTTDGVFRYTGEGQSGDMTFEKGNKAIRDHRKNKRDLLLFQDLGKGKDVRFAGVFECMSWSVVDGKSKTEASRKVIVFDLVPVATAATATPTLVSAPPPELPLSDLRQKAYNAAASPAANNGARATKQTWYARSEQVRQYVLARAMGSVRRAMRPRRSSVGMGHRIWSPITRRGWPMRDWIIQRRSAPSVPRAIDASIQARMARRGMSGYSSGSLRKNKQRRQDRPRPWCSGLKRALFSASHRL